MLKSAIRIISAILLVLCMSFIFKLSSENATASSERSNVVVEKTVKVIYKDYESLPKEKQVKVTEEVSHYVRKTAHFCIFAALGFCAFLNVALYDSVKKIFKYLSSVLFSLLYAISDEVHQMFVAGRGPSPVDVGIDFCGAVLGIIIIALIFRFLIWGKKDNAKRKKEN